MIGSQPFAGGWRRIAAAALAVWSIGTAAGAADLAGDQRELAARYDRLEAIALRIADLAGEGEQARADQIRAAIAKSRELGVDERFERVVGLLEAERLAAARSDQSELAAQLEELLRLVTADPGEARLDDERRRLEELVRGLNRAIRGQRSLRARTERLSTPAPNEQSDAIREEQEQLADRVERLAILAEEDPEGGDAIGDDAPAGSEALGEQLGKADGAMRGAARGLSRGKSGEAREQQREAQRRLEAARRLAERALRQVREEEQQRRLASLADRLRKLLTAERAIASGVSGAPTAERGRAARIVGAKLADQQADAAEAAGRALRLVEEDGRSLVFAEAIRQSVTDMRAIERRLRDARFGALTESLVRGVVESLEEMLAAVDQELEQLHKNQEGGSRGGGGAAGDPGLIGRLAELRMLRSVQARLLRKTESWRQAGAAGEATADELETGLAALAIEQQRLASAAEFARRQAAGR